MKRSDLAIFKESPVPKSELGKQGLSQAIEGRPKIFWVDACFAGDGHEIGIANPAGQHVKVQVAGHPGAGSLAQIHP
jgi:hypothetical protein